MTTYFTSDLHLTHNKPFIYQPRGFENIQEHDIAVIKNINNTVETSDTLYILGDLIVGDNSKGIDLLNQIQCKDIRVIVGNHDTDNRIKAYQLECPNIMSVDFAARFKYKKWSFWLSHYPAMTANFDDGKKSLRQRTWCLCGHTHTNSSLLDVYNGCYHVDLDAHNCTPVSIDDIIEDLRQWWHEETQFRKYLDEG